MVNCMLLLRSIQRNDEFSKKKKTLRTFAKPEAQTKINVACVMVWFACLLHIRINANLFSLFLAFAMRRWNGRTDDDEVVMDAFVLVTDSHKVMSYKKHLYTASTKRTNACKHTTIHFVVSRATRIINS